MRALARFLIRAAGERRLVTYAEVAREFGGIARGQGPRLERLTEACHRLALPLLPILVVNRGTRQPSVRAEAYKRRGIASLGMIDAEQRRCFGHDWRGAAELFPEDA